MPHETRSTTNTMSLARATWLILGLSTLVILATNLLSPPLWDEDETRFAAIAQTMLNTGDWIVPTYNQTLAVDKPVLMHWCIAVAFALFGTSEFAARLPAALATIVTALVILRTAARWFDIQTGLLAAIAFISCVLIGIESHAATPDAILVMLTTLTTILVADGLLPSTSNGTLTRMSTRRAIGIGSLCGLAVLCKGPVGYAGPLGVAGVWAMWIACEEHFQRVSSGERQGLFSIAQIVAKSAVQSLICIRPIVITLAMLAVAVPWYLAVHVRTFGEWTSGFFLVHNVGRFAAPMENHNGGPFFQSIALLIGFYPWSCFLPLALGTTAWKLWKNTTSRETRAPLGLLMLWIVIWLLTFSLAATKLANYVLPVYPAAALLVAAIGVEASRRERWPHPRWMIAGIVSFGLGGIALTTGILVASRLGLSGAEAAALIGVIPIVGAAMCLRAAHKNDPLAAIHCFAVTSLIFLAVLVGPGAWYVGRSNTLPSLISDAHRLAGGRARLASYQENAHSVAFYAGSHVAQPDSPEAIVAFLESGSDAFLVIPENYFDEISQRLPEEIKIVKRVRPIFRKQDSLLIGRARRDPENLEQIGANPGGVIR